MKVCINWLERYSNTAPSIFARRLSNEFEKLGVGVVDRHSPHDILLAFIRESEANISYSRSLGAKVVQRLDGVYYEKGGNYLQMNEGISRTHELSDAVIYQSKFSREMARLYNSRSSR